MVEHPHMADPYHWNRPLARTICYSRPKLGTPYRIGTYLKRVVKPIAATCGDSGHDLPGSAPTFATEFSAPWIAERCAGSVAALQAGDDGAGICQYTEANAPPDAGKPQ